MCSSKQKCGIDFCMVKITLNRCSLILQRKLGFWHCEIFSQRPLGHKMAPTVLWGFCPTLALDYWPSWPGLGFGQPLSGLCCYCSSVSSPISLCPCYFDCFSGCCFSASSPISLSAPATFAAVVTTATAISSLCSCSSCCHCCCVLLPCS